MAAGCLVMVKSGPSSSIIYFTLRTGQLTGQQVDASPAPPIITFYFCVQGAAPMDDAIRKAEVLIEALSYIRNFHNRLTVIKLGGSAMENPDALRATLQDVVFMATVGMRPILVHG